ncbi:patatin-like phospholipase family protein [Bdellovibrio sp. HCB337]|uniref:patatin-like phospholipase family protein n=1 Tax=Bdellovibrio sp. HCB337 TaxID=3394358 RepID=UPI0039A61464
MLLNLFFVAACQHLRTRDDIEAEKEGAQTETPSGPVQPPKYEVPTPQAPTQEAPPQASPIPAIPKIGLILGPGGARAYGHIGAVQNLNRLKVPVYGTVGIEWGAPAAALLSSKGQVYDMEWQMFKLKGDELNSKSLIGSGGKANDVSALKDFFHTAFGGLKVENFKHPFGCPAYNISKNQVYMMSRGVVEQLMPYCLPYPPLFKPFNRNVSAMRELKMAADYLRSQGANYIVLINVLGRDAGKKSLVRETESTDAVVWSEIASYYAKAQAGVDAVIPVELDGYMVTDFDKRREIMQKAAEVSQKPIEIWARKLGF